ncbi:hypothetical protein [Lyngbya aestuarii]|uniref:hypothetical protein n=1 Tax=Lyngbya aestuarii TaxID=118322 RepID=UPI00403DBA8E
MSAKELQGCGSLVIEGVLKRLRRDLSRVKASFTCFDVAFFYYWRLVHPEVPLDAAGFTRRMERVDMGNNAACSSRIAVYLESIVILCGYY